MDKKVRDFFRKYMIICIVLALLLSLGAAAYADYVRSSRTLRVIAAYGEQRNPFSSNYLRPALTTEENPKTIHIDDEGGASETITIGNHPQSSNSVSEVDISYQISATLLVYDLNTSSYRTATAADFNLTNATSLVLKFNGSTEHTFIGGGSLNATFTSSSKSLARYILTDHTLTVVSSGALASCQCGALAIDIVADPGNAPGAPDVLRGRLQLSLPQGAKETAWSGAFEWDAGTAIGDYDGYNYAIKSNGAGEGTYTLTWDSDQLELNRAFLEFYLKKQFGDDFTATASSVTFLVDPDYVARYDLQFFPAGNYTPASKDEVDALVTFRAVTA